MLDVDLGPFSLWMTINPSDINNPIVQMFAGVPLDINVGLTLPDYQQRAKNITEDPHAAARFFHFLTQTILKKLFQVKMKGHKVKSATGSRAHLHMFWSHGKPRPWYITPPSHFMVVRHAKVRNHARVVDMCQFS
jgi:Helitron helicase-like domain at N-terminus